MLLNQEFVMTFKFYYLSEAFDGELDSEWFQLTTAQGQGTIKESILKMWSEILSSLSLLLIVGIPLLISADDATVDCEGAIKNGRLELTEVVGSKNNSNIAERCAVLKIHLEPEARVDWEKIEKSPMPKLTFLVIYLTTDFGSEYIRNYGWRNASIFGYEPEEVARRELTLLVYLNFDAVVLDYSSVVNTLKIVGIDCNPILKKFKDQNITIQTMVLEKTILELDDAESRLPDGVETLTLGDVEFRNGNLTGLTQQLTSLEGLTLEHKNWTQSIDVGSVISAVRKNMTYLSIWNSNLTFTTNPPMRSETIRILDIYNCIVDPSFRENIWNAVPKLEELNLELNSTTFDLSDLSPMRQLSQLYIRDTKLTFTNSTHKFLAMNLLTLKDCQFDSTFGEDTLSAFPNLKEVFILPGWIENKSEKLKAVGIAQI